MYTLSKIAIPMDVEFMLGDTFESLRPKLTRWERFDEAAAAVEEMMAAVAKSGPVEEEPEDQEPEGGEEGRRMGGDEAESGEESEVSFYWRCLHLLES